MDNFSVDYSIYKYKIVDLEIQDWPDCTFTLRFKGKLSKKEWGGIANAIDDWFIKEQEKDKVGGFHSLSIFEQKDLKTLKFLIDFGSADLSALKSLLNFLSGWADKVSVLEIGEVKGPELKYIYKTTDFPGVDVTGATFKVTQIQNNDPDWPLTLYFKIPIDTPSKDGLQKTINEWYSEIKDPENATDPWIQDIDWRDEKTASWWISGQSGRAAIFNDLVKKLEAYSEIIEELIIGARFPTREKIYYPRTSKELKELNT